MKGKNDRRIDNTKLEMSRQSILSWLTLINGKTGVRVKTLDDHGASPPTNPERFDQGKQTKGVSVEESHELRKPQMVRGMDWGSEGVVEVKNGGGAAGMAGQGTYAETVRVMGEIGDDHFDDFQGKPRGGRRVHHRGGPRKFSR